MTKTRNICVVITARPSYSRVKTALKAINNHPELHLQLIVSGSALLKRYGEVVNIIEKDGFYITEKIYNALEGENLTTTTKTTGLALIELGNIFYNLKPHMVVTIADRYETISTSIAAAYQNIPLVHIQGGEVSGNIDEKVRHANTKLADIHLVASENARERVIKMGEDPAMVFNTGCPSIDIANEILQSPELDFDPISKYGGVGADFDFSRGYIVVMQHPETTQYQHARGHITETLMAINELEIPTFWFWPNIDSGSDGISMGIRHFRETHSLRHIHFFKNMEPHDFLKLLYNSQCLVGNSSVGIRECSFLGIPVVNIGKRQEGRDQGVNVIDINYDKESIKNAINISIAKKKRKGVSLYGDGKSGERIANILAKVELRFCKRIMY